MTHKPIEKEANENTRRMKNKGKTQWKLLECACLTNPLNLMAPHS